MSSIVEIPLQEILLATNNFAKENRIGSGGFGPVYEGKSEKHGIIAVTRLDRKYGQGDPQFKKEIALLSEYKHENIVSLLGFCDENDEKILVYKLESNGSLDKHLNNKDLSWIQRLRICLDAARGLKYLHDDVGPQQRILHRDVKSANILLDENWNAKISDFGLSRIGPANMQTTLLISNACGTFGYIDPEYLHTGCLTQRSDVYSFGVVLFEVLCGRPTRVAAYKDERELLIVLVYKHYATQTLDKIIHFDIQNQINEASLLTFSTIAYQCLKTGSERPTMNKVVQQLQKALDNQLESSGSRPYDVYNGLGDFGDDDIGALTKTQRGGKVKKKGPKRNRQRVSFMTKSEIDHLEDGYRWRKYGQKAVNNSPFPRNYYRCTNSQCKVKKSVERSSTDPRTVITTYEGQHCHHTIGFPRGIINPEGAHARYLAPSSTSQQLIYPRAQLPQIGNLGVSRLHSLQPPVVVPSEAGNHGSHEQPDQSSFQADSRVDQGLLGDIKSPKTCN